MHWYGSNCENDSIQKIVFHLHECDCREDDKPLYINSFTCNVTGFIFFCLFIYFLTFIFSGRVPLRVSSLFRGRPDHTHTVTHSHLEAAQCSDRLICSHWAAPLERLGLGALLKGPQRWNMGGASSSLHYHHPHKCCWLGIWTGDLPITNSHCPKWWPNG